MRTWRAPFKISNINHIEHHNLGHDKLLINKKKSKKSLFVIPIVNKISNLNIIFRQLALNLRTSHSLLEPRRHPRPGLRKPVQQ